jgi:hypothetical protein
MNERYFEVKKQEPAGYHKTGNNIRRLKYLGLLCFDLEVNNPFILCAGTSAADRGMSRILCLCR